MTLLEAMVAGRPIIATSIGSNRELAAQAEMAQLVPPGDPQALCNAVLRFVREPALRAQVGSNARALFESRYTETRMLRSYLQLYFDLIKLKCADETIATLPACTFAGLETPGRRLFCEVHSDASSDTGQLMARAATIHRAKATQISGRGGVIRKALASDLPGIVAIHQAAFRRFFLTRLGRDFLVRYYGLVLNYRAGIVLVSEKRGALQGFVSGFVDSSEFYRFMWSKRRMFVLPVLIAFVRHPSLGTKVLQGIQRIQTQATGGLMRSCELSSIAVAPVAAGSGLGMTLMRAFLAQAWSMDAQCVSLATDADDNERANALYRRAGFQHVRRFLHSKGRWMNEYVIQRVDAYNS
jgi:ribosomal protein S18 acetylase RimI-like enzyme